MASKQCTILATLSVLIFLTSMSCVNGFEMAQTYGKVSSYIGEKWDTFQNFWSPTISAPVVEESAHESHEYQDPDFAEVLRANRDKRGWFSGLFRY